MQTLKLSHTIISMWKQGKYEDAVGMYLGKDLPITPAMELGRLYDKKWNNHIEKTGELPEELGGGKLDNPKVQVKYQVIIPLSEEYQILLRGVPDLTEPTMITDYKCGHTEANGYIDKMQLDYYSLFIPEATIGRYICFNPYMNTRTVGIKFLTDENRENAINEIVTYGADILQYLIANKLFKNYEIK